MLNKTKFYSKDATRPDAVFRSINPYNGELLGEFPTLTLEQLDLKLAEGEKAFTTFWKKQSLADRQAAIGRVVVALEEQEEALARLITLEMGKPISESRAEISKCRWLCQHFIDHAPQYLQEEWIDERSYVQCQALGGILGIMPWNFPFWQAFRFAIPTLLAGNTVMLKHAANVPQCAQQIEQIISQAIGHPAVFSNFFVEESQVIHLVQHPHTQGVALTGSEKAGTAVGEIASKELKKCVLELGGSDAFIVLADAEVELAVEKAVLSRMKATGQTCISAKRIIVEAPIANAFISSLCQRLTALQGGDPLDPDTQFSVMARPDLLYNLQRQVRDSVKMGAHVLLEGGAREEGSNYFAPMVLTDIRPGMPLYEEEVFGPVAAVFVVADEAEAMRLANDTPYGLGAAIWTADLARAKQLTTQLEVGAVAINNLVSSRPDLPFGGVKRSGFGKEMGKEGMLEFVNRQTVVIG